ncbi:diacylglycerol kinase [Robertkochia sediminum]|uniref:diacylglycerol kinase n=1 Tax=Robertkochia sediminum TaxID=2785326 RepID=UPI00193274E6|nr:diacylglycerol kinase family protein [Robertkochia sediminum]MBL7473334.1 diacylglycerol kinase family protein [Robertkochia sediminum]
MSSFLRKRIKSIGYASKGAYLLLKHEPSIQVQAVIACAVTILGLVVGLTATEWCIQNLTITVIMTAEGLNTAIEKTADFVHPEHHPMIGRIKDVAAGAVMIAALGAVLVGLFIYIPKFF